MDENALEKALAIQAVTGTTQPIGAVLVEQRMIDADTLTRVLEMQRHLFERRAATFTPADTLSETLLAAAREAKAAELVVSENRAVRIRVGNEWRACPGEPVTGPQVWDFVREVVGYDVLEAVAEHGSVVRSWSHPTHGGGSARIFRHFEGVAVRIAFAPAPDLTAGDVGLPQAVIDTCRTGRGLILVASERGIGRGAVMSVLARAVSHDSSSMVALLDDEPLPLADCRSLVVRHRFGATRAERATAVRDAVRYDPDALLVADVGDADVFEISLRAAEGGRLVVGCIDAASVAGTLQRVFDFYRVHDLERVRSSLATTLRAIVTRHAMLHANGSDTVTANELLLVDERVREALRKGDLTNIQLLLRAGDGACGHSLDICMLQLLQSGQIRMADAFARAEEKAWLLERTKAMNAEVV
ncbi:MAG: ATPase, T2SS/T4P/T4SS family [Planctomycetota bacterium]